MKYDVFVSYSRADVDIVTDIVNDIHDKTKAKCWIDWNGVESGDKFVDVIVSAIDSVDTVLFMLSDNAMKSAYVKKEIEYARNTNKKVIPVVLDGGELRGWFLFQFGDINYIDIHKPLERNQLFDNLIKWYGASNGSVVSRAEAKHLSVPQPLSVRVYKVGDYYNENGKEGIVFDVWDFGRHGLIVSLDEANLPWCTSEEAEKHAVGAIDEVKGRVNADLVMARSDSYQYPAFVWCREKGEDWYLPSKDELSQLAKVFYDVLFALRARGEKYVAHFAGFHWSSTETNDKLSAWSIGIGAGRDSAFNHRKTSFNYVRAVATF